jgi:hypothetical protein
VAAPAVAAAEAASRPRRVSSVISQALPSGRLSRP